MAESLRSKTLVAVAMPIIRARAFWLAASLGLRWHDRDDLEQELWLELLLRHGGGDGTGSLDSDEPEPLGAVRLQLQQEVQQIAAALARSWPFWRRIRPALERFFIPFQSGILTAPDPRAEVRLRDLSLDITGLLAELPAADRQLCQSLMTGSAGSLASAACDPAEVASRLVALWNDFIALDLHEYL